MNSLVDADTQRFVACLVLGYLENQQLQKAYNSFCQTSRHLTKEKQALKYGNKPLDTSAGLVNIVSQYFELKYRINEFLRTSPQTNLVIRLIDTDDTLQRLEVILDALKENLHRIDKPPPSTKKRKLEPEVDDNIFDVSPSKASTPEVIHPSKRMRKSLSTPFLTISANKENKTKSVEKSGVGKSELEFVDSTSDTSTKEDDDEEESPKDVAGTSLLKANTEQLSETFLQKPDFVEKVVNIINRTRSAKETVPNELLENGLTNDDLNDIMSKTQNDPSFDEIVNDIVNKYLLDFPGADTAQSSSTLEQSIESQEVPIKQRLRPRSEKKAPALQRRKKINIISDEPYTGIVPEVANLPIPAAEPEIQHVVVNLPVYVQNGVEFVPLIQTIPVGSMEPTPQILVEEQPVVEPEVPVIPERSGNLNLEAEKKQSTPVNKINPSFLDSKSKSTPRRKATHVRILDFNNTPSSRQLNTIKEQLTPVSSGIPAVTPGSAPATISSAKLMKPAEEPQNVPVADENSNSNSISHTPKVVKNRKRRKIQITKSAEKNPPQEELKQPTLDMSMDEWFTMRQMSKNIPIDQQVRKANEKAEAEGKVLCPKRRAQKRKTGKKKATPKKKKLSKSPKNGEKSNEENSTSIEYDENKPLIKVKIKSPRKAASAKKKRCENAKKKCESAKKKIENAKKNFGNLLKSPENVMKTQDNFIKNPENSIKNPEIFMKNPENVLKTNENFLQNPENVLKNHETLMENPENSMKNQENSSHQENSLVESPENPRKIPENEENNFQNNEKTETVNESVDGPSSLNRSDTVQEVATMLTTLSETILAKSTKKSSTELLETPFKGIPETPFKDVSLTPLPNTPRFAIPLMGQGSHETPMPKTFASTTTVTSLVKFCDILTPNFPITPGIKETPLKEGEPSPTSASGYSSRRTDYSSCSSYYKPDESEDINTAFLNPRRSTRNSQSESDVEKPLAILGSAKKVECPGAIERVKSFEKEIPTPHYTMMDEGLLSESFVGTATEDDSDDSSSSFTCSTCSTDPSDEENTMEKLNKVNTDVDSEWNCDEDEDAKAEDVESPAVVNEKTGEVRFPLRNWITPRKIDPEDDRPEWKNQPEVRRNQPEVRRNQPEVRRNQPEVKDIQQKVQQNEPEVQHIQPEVQKPQPEMKETHEQRLQHLKEVRQRTLERIRQDSAAIKPKVPVTKLKKSNQRTFKLPCEEVQKPAINSRKDQILQQNLSERPRPTPLKLIPSSSSRRKNATPRKTIVIDELPRQPSPIKKKREKKLENSPAKNDSLILETVNDNAVMPETSLYSSLNISTSFASSFEDESACTVVAGKGNVEEGSNTFQNMLITQGFDKSEAKELQNKFVDEVKPDESSSTEDDDEDELEIVSAEAMRKNEFHFVEPENFQRKNPPQTSHKIAPMIINFDGQKITLTSSGVIEAFSISPTKNIQKNGKKKSPKKSDEVPEKIKNGKKEDSKCAKVPKFNVMEKKPLKNPSLEINSTDIKSILDKLHGK